MNLTILLIILIILIVFVLMLFEMKKEHLNATSGYYLITWDKQEETDNYTIVITKDSEQKEIVNETVTEETDNYTIVITKDSEQKEIVNETVTEESYKFVNPEWETKYTVSVTANNKYGKSQPTVTDLKIISPIDGLLPSPDSMNMGLQLSFKSQKDPTQFDASESTIVLLDSAGTESKCEYTVDMTSGYDGKPYKYLDGYLVRFQMSYDCSDGFKEGQQIIGTLVLSNEFGKTSSSVQYTIPSTTPTVPPQNPTNLTVKYVSM